MHNSTTLEDNHLFQTYLDNTSRIFFSRTPVDSWPVQYVSKNVNQFGYSAEDFLSGKIKYEDIIFKEDYNRVAQEVKEYTKNSKNQFNQVYRIVRKDKKIRWIDDHTIIERNCDGSVKNYLGTVHDITDEKELQQKITQSEEKFRNFAESSQTGFFIYQENIIYANKSLSDQSGYSLEELESMHIWDFADESCKEEVKEIVLKRCRGEVLDQEVHDFKFITKSGEPKTVRTITQTIMHNGSYAGAGTIIDITDIIEAQHKLTLLAQAIQQTGDLVKITNQDGKIVFVNDSVVEQTGYENTEIIGQKPNIFKSGKHDNDYYENLWSTLLDGETFRGVFINKKKDGKLYYEEETITPIDNPENGVQYFMVTGKDVTERVELEHELYRRATIDSLTGIYNRQRCSEQLDIEINRYNRYNDEFALIMVDIDDFKHVNDTYGHDVGDDVLKQACDIISKETRKSDIFSRWGGEEFMIIAHCSAEKDAIEFSEKLRKKIHSTFFEKIENITVSIGITFPKKAESKKDLLKRVDSALYKAKNSGKNKVHIL
ncbi:diguanylate cyclase [Sulfurimonas sp.]